MSTPIATLPPVPPLGIHRKLEIAQELWYVFNFVQEEHQYRELGRLMMLWSREDKSYAKFWWEREKERPDWRDQDPNQGTPIVPRLTIVKE